MPAPLQIRVAETFTGRGMSYALGGVAEYTRCFHATSNVVTDQQAILLAAGIPRCGDFYVTAQGGVDVRSTCRKLDVRQRAESPVEWSVEAHYSSAYESSRNDGASDTGGSPSEAAIDNPLLRPTQVQPGTKKYSRPVEYDALPTVGGGIFGNGIGNPVLNAAGDKFDPPLMQDVSALTLTITRNFATLSFANLAAYHGCLNLAQYLGFGPKCLKVDELSAVYTYENGVYFYAVKAVLESAPVGETHVRAVLNCGYGQLVGGKRVPIVMAGGGFPPMPQMLTPGGKWIQDAAIDGKPNYISVQDAPTLDFLLLRLF